MTENKHRSYEFEIFYTCYSDVANIGEGKMWHTKPTFNHRHPHTIKLPTEDFVQPKFYSLFVYCIIWCSSVRFARVIVSRYTGHAVMSMQGKLSCCRQFYFSSQYPLLSVFICCRPH